MGIDEASPRLSWMLGSRGRGTRQTAYQILVSEDGIGRVAAEGGMWDTGKVTSPRTTQIEYAGKPLRSGARYFWKVRVWDQEGNPSRWSRSASWSMGLLEEKDWRAHWIGRFNSPPGGQGASDLSPPAFLRNEFASKGAARRATLYVTARGLFEISINGRRVGEDRFTPGWSSYNSRLYYLTYDVTDMLAEGKNAIGAIIADGWYAGYVGFSPPGRDGWKRRRLYGEKPALLLQLDITYPDGSAVTIASDGSWRAATGPILDADILMGETYDARLEMPGWDAPGFDDSNWKPVHLPWVPRVRLQAYPAMPVREMETIRPVRVTRMGPDSHLFDMGQNFAGRVRLAVSGTAGEEISLRYGEMLRSDNTLMTENLRSARATDRYILRGGGRETWEPRFTYHGFRYVQVKGFPGVPHPDNIVGVVLHSALPATGSFSTSSDLVNRLYRAIIWTQRSNFVDIPTDCPQRDERLGWAGDILAFADSAAFNMDVAAFLTKWLEAMRDDQRPSGAFPDFAPMPFLLREPSPGWMDGGIIVPHVLYRMYGDRRVVARHYPSMKRFMAFLVEISRDFLLRPHGDSWGDWKALDTRTSKDLIGTAFFAHDAKLMAEMARAIGAYEDSRYYDSLFERVRSAFNRAFLSENGRIETETQTAYALALSMGLLDESLSGAAGDRLVELISENGWRLSTGFLGTRFLLPALTKAGRPEIALRLLLNRGFPSWGFMLNSGATTLWERWDGFSPKSGIRDPENTSFNHYALGSVGGWLFSELAGIQAATPGFQEIIIRPTILPDAIRHIRATYRSVHGEILSEWTADGDLLRGKVSIPPNTTAALHLPAADPRGISEGGDPSQAARGWGVRGVAPGQVTLFLDSGDYEFETKLPESVLQTKMPEEPADAGFRHVPVIPWRDGGAGERYPFPSLPACHPSVFAGGKVPPGTRSGLRFPGPRFLR